MKKELILCAVMAGAFFRLGAQEPCHAAADKMTSWLKLSHNGPQSGPRFPVAELPSVRAVQESLIALVRHAYPQPKGVEAKPFGINLVDFTDYPNEPANSPLHYQANVNFKGYFCIGDKVFLGDETGTWIKFHINTLSGFMDPVNEKLQLSTGKPLFFQPELTGKFQGYPVYTPFNGFNNRNIENIIISRAGYSPFKPVNMEELLNACIGYLDSQTAQYHRDNQELRKTLAQTIAYAQKINFKTPQERTNYIQEQTQGVEDGEKKRGEMVGAFLENKQILIGYLNELGPEKRKMQAYCQDPFETFLSGKSIPSYEELRVTGRPLASYNYFVLPKGSAKAAARFIQLELRWENDDYNLAKKQMIGKFKQNIRLSDVAALLK